MDSKLRALLMCTLMIASALAGCLGGDDDDEEPAEPVMGCMDEAATNYNSEADEDDGSCEYGMAQADIMSAYASGDMAFSDAWYNLSVSRKCRELGTNLSLIHI